MLFTMLRGFDPAGVDFDPWKESLAENLFFFLCITLDLNFSMELFIRFDFFDY